MPAAEELLLKAAGSVEKEPHRWIQKNQSLTVGRERRACMLGLLVTGGVFDHPSQYPAPYTVDRAIKLLRERTNVPVSTWNDAEGRTPEEVVAMLREAARRSEQT